MAEAGETIIRIGAKGDGLTRDGRVVPMAAPLDRIAADGSIIPGPHRAVPPCRHFPQCGGCQLQHVDDTALADFVRDRVCNALEGQGIVADTIARVHLSPPRTRRRASLRAMRVGRRILLGFSEARSHRIVDLAECHILCPALFAMIAPLRALLGQVLPARGQAAVALAMTVQGVDCLLGGVPMGGLAGHEALTGFAREQALARLTLDTGDGPEPLWEPQPVTVTLSGTAVPYPPHAFLQATHDGEAHLVGAVMSAIGSARTVADLFAGLGTFAFAAATGARVYAAEADRASLAALKAGAARAGIAIAAEQRDLYRRPLDTGELSRFDAVILDPPRAGAADQVARLATADVPRIAYVSCNPASFARDAKMLVTAGWSLEEVVPVGQFRWSTHVELVGRFTR